MNRVGLRNFGAGEHALSMLAVLLCTAGALVAVLGAANRQQRLRAVAVAEAPAADDAKADREMLEWRVEQLKQARQKTAAQLEDDRLKLSHLEDHARRLREQLERLIAGARQMENLDGSTAYKRRAAETELDDLKRRIAKTEAELATLTQQGPARNVSYSIVPYAGPNGTRRRPIYIECRADSIVIQPEQIVLVESDFEGPLGPGNPLAATLRALREYLVAQQTAMAAEKAEPYPLLLVRPDGIPAYYAARAALTSWGSEFGYEFVEQDWKLKFQEPDPRQAELARRVIEEARLRQRELVLAAPREYGRRGAAKMSFRASPRGGFVPDGGSQASNSQANEHKFGGKGSASKGGSTKGGASKGGGRLPDEPFAMAQKSPGGPAGQSNPSGADPSAADRSGTKKPPQVKPLAESRGADWGLPDAARGSVGVTRPVAILCYADRLVILSEQGTGGGKQIVLTEATQDSVDELVSSVWAHIKTWGIAGKGLYWKPILSMDVQPGAATRFAELQSLLNDSGLEVKQRGKPASPALAVPNQTPRR